MQHSRTPSTNWQFYLATARCKWSVVYYLKDTPHNSFASICKRLLTLNRCKAPRRRFSDCDSLSHTPSESLRPGSAERWARRRCHVPLFNNNIIRCDTQARFFLETGWSVSSGRAAVCQPQACYFTRQSPWVGSVTVQRAALPRHDSSNYCMFPCAHWHHAPRQSVILSLPKKIRMLYEPILGIYHISVHGPASLSFITSLLYQSHHFWSLHKTLLGGFQSFLWNT